MAITDPGTLGLVRHTRAGATERAVRGVNAPLIICTVPAGAEALIGKPLGGQVLTVDGAYGCLIPVAGLAASLKVRTKATLDAMTATTAGPDEIALLKASGAMWDPYVDAFSDAVVVTAGTGDGALTTTVEQVASLTPTGGIYALFTLTTAGTPTSVTMTEAEYTGL